MPIRHYLLALAVGAGLIISPAALAKEGDPPPLHLTDAQRAQICDAVRTVNSEVEFHLKTTKSAKDFEPKIGAKIPKGVVGQTLPPPVIYSVPTLKEYLYVKMKNEILIVNPMTSVIVDAFPET